VKSFSNFKIFRFEIGNIEISSKQAGVTGLKRAIDSGPGHKYIRIF
jgi:hypothetical protein